MNDSIGSAYIPKLLGIYEKELAPSIERACQLDWQQLIDVGAGEGYYVVGMALRNPTKPIVAFEMDAEGRELLATMAALNGVDHQIEICGKCDVEDLQQVLTGDRTTLLICDVEGYERVLLDPVKIPALAHAFILVELHDFASPGLSDDIYQRFQATHQIQPIQQTPRSSEEFPFTADYPRPLPEVMIEWTVAEWRSPQMSWFWMEPYSHHQSHA
ncbi:MAG: hypothetical protein HC925_06575 [Coleofasciculaceae cyanobacterium SM2_3_26]|nr:hypothetical protein [Coleofasciculaceae cyanobacterium SM2_3_26]